MNAYPFCQAGKVAGAMRACSAEEGPLMIMCCKSFHRPNDYAAFDVLGRVMSGTIHKRQKLRVRLERGGAVEKRLSS